MDKTGTSLTGGEGIDNFLLSRKLISVGPAWSSGATFRIRSDGSTPDASSALVTAARCSSVKGPETVKKRGSGMVRSLLWHGYHQVGQLLSEIFHNDAGDVELVFDNHAWCFER